MVKPVCGAVAFTHMPVEFVSIVIREVNPFQLTANEYHSNCESTFYVVSIFTNIIASSGRDMCACFA